MPWGRTLQGFPIGPQPQSTGRWQPALPGCFSTWLIQQRHTAGSASDVAGWPETCMATADKIHAGRTCLRAAARGLEHLTVVLKLHPCCTHSKLVSMGSFHNWEAGCVWSWLLDCCASQQAVHGCIAAMGHDACPSLNLTGHPSLLLGPVEA